MGVLSRLIKRRATPDGAVGRFDLRLNIDGECLAGSFDATAWRLFGLSKAPPKGERLFPLLDKRLAHTFGGAVYECVLKKRTMIFQAPRPEEEGFEWLLVVLAPGEGTVRGGKERTLSGTVVDVTILAGSELVQHFTEYVDRYLLTTMERMADPVILCAMREDELPVLHVNNAFTRVFGYLPQEARGRDALHLVFTRSLDSVKALLRRPQTWRREHRWQVFECRGVEKRDFSCHVMMDYHGDREEPELVRFTFLVERSASGGWQGQLGASERQRIETETILNASAALINDFGNLLNVVLDDERLTSGRAADVAETVRASHEKAREAAAMLHEVLAASLSGRIAEADPSYVPVEEATMDLRKSLANMPKLHVLVVDDEPSLRLVVSRALHTVGHEATVVATGTEAVELLGATASGAPKMHADFLIVDQHLDDMPGLTVIEMARSCGIKTPAILVSGYFSDLVKQRASAVWPLVLLEKPFKISEMLFAIRELMQRAAEGNGGESASPAAGAAGDAGAREK